MCVCVGGGGGQNRTYFKEGLIKKFASLLVAALFAVHIMCVHYVKESTCMYKMISLRSRKTKTYS